MIRKIASSAFGLLAITILLSGCIRLTGSAGYYKQGADEEEAKGKTYSFDTQDLVDPNRSKGNIVIQ